MPPWNMRQAEHAISSSVEEYVLKRTDRFVRA